MDTGPAPVVPAVTSAVVQCDGAAAVWSFSMATDAWTGGGDLTWSADGIYVETSELTTQDSAVDGTAESLALDLYVVPDFRDVVSGSTTVFNCDTPGLAGVLRVFTRDGAETADCRLFGADVATWDAWALGVPCATPLDEAGADTGQDTGAAARVSGPS